MGLLNEDDLNNLLFDVTYRPGWNLKVHTPDPYQGLFLSVIAEVANAYDPSSTTELRIHSPVPPMHTPAEFYRWLLWRLKQIEIHESMEWFQIKGKPYCDPHRAM